MEVKNYFATDTQGNVLGSAQVYLYLAGTTTLATGLQNISGAALGNPFTSDANGLVQFKAPDNNYDLRVVKPGREFTIRIQCFDGVYFASSIEGIVLPIISEQTSVYSEPNKIPLSGSDGKIGDDWLSASINDDANVLAFGADPTGLSSSVNAFNLAAQKNGQVTVPAGTFLIDSPTVEATWVLRTGSKITGLPLVGGNSIQDLSRLKGRVFAYRPGGRINFRMGDGDPWLEKNIRNFSESLSNAVFLSPEGRVGALFASRASGNSSSNMATIGFSAYGVNDNAAVPKTSWSGYLEFVRFPNCGPAINTEMDGVNLGDTYVLDPYKQMAAYDATKAHTVHLWLSCGGGDSGLAAGANNMSAAIVTLPNSKKFDKGWVVRNGSIETGEVIAAPNGYKYTWYSATGLINSFIDHRTIDQRTRIDSSLGNTWFSRKNRSSGATIALDAVHQHTFYSGEASDTSYTGASVTVRQRTAFSGSNARHSYDVQARNQDGTFSEISLNGVADKSFAPIADGVLNFGGPSNRINNSYFAVAPTVSSDIRYKDCIREIPDAALDAIAEIQPKICKMKDAIAEKGESDARWHVTWIAQDVIEAFSRHGVDAHEYGLLCHDKWPAQPAVEEVFDEDGNLLSQARPAIEAGDRYGLRYTEIEVLLQALAQRTIRRMNESISAMQDRIRELERKK